MASPPLPSFGPKSVTHVSGTFCNLCLRPDTEIKGFPVVGAQREGDKMRLGVGFSTPNSEFFFPLTSQTCLRMAADIEDGPGYLPPRGVRIVNQMEMRFAHRRIYSASLSERTREHFDHWFGDVRIGENALVPMWEGKPIL